VKTVQRVKRHFRCDTRVVTHEKKYEIEFFITLLDPALMSVKGSFEQLHQQPETWGFLYKIGELTKN
jgi:hypothetical protein